MRARRVPSVALARQLDELVQTLGDIGFLDADRFLYLTDRKANMIISGGVNIYPQETENLLITHPRVLDVAVFGVPDPDFGEVVVAVIVPEPGKTSEPQALRALARERLAGFKVSKQVLVIGELPRNALGKVEKARLRALAAQIG